MDWLTTLESLVMGALGGTAAVFGLSKFLGGWWLERQKARYSTELEQFRDSLQKEQRRVQAEIDRSVFVTRAHFETEFSAMKELFKCLSKARLVINGVRPTLDVRPSNEDATEKTRRLFDRLEGLCTAYNELIASLEDLRPFYPPELYSAAEECVKAAKLEIYQVKTGNERTFSSAWFIEGAQNQERFSIAYARASELIRARVEKLAVLPST